MSDRIAEIPLPSGHVVLVDEADYEAVVAAGPWHAQRARRPRTGVYARRVVRRPEGGTTYQLLHVFLMNQRYIDHANGNGLDNRRANLRPATHSQNNANRGPQRNNASGFKGISFNRRKRRWQADIQVDGRSRYLGRYGTPEEAARVYDAAALEAFGEFAWLNFPPSAA